jgi:hypothetical protein
MIPHTQRSKGQNGGCQKMGLGGNRELTLNWYKVSVIQGVEDHSYQYNCTLTFLLKG